jgi:P-type Ca2+ transporter type 2C
MNEKGLSEKEVKKRLEKYGKNVLERKKKVSPWKILFSQFKSPLIIILIVAAIILALITRYSPENNLVDIILILVIVFASALSSFFQDYKAEKSIEALQKMAQPKARVIRNGEEKIIESSKIVPGDIIVLSGGDVIPADAKILESSQAKFDESALTGESSAVSKKEKDEIYKNTYLTIGNVTAKVFSTGMETRMGSIAEKLGSMEEEKSVFYKEMSVLSKKLSWIVLGIAVLVLIVGLFKFSLYQSVLTAVALAVAAIPEGLPAVITLSLALGARAMMKKKTLVRKLGVTESLGSVNIICSDKTGTITKGEMAVTDVFLNKEYKLEELDKSKIKEMLYCSILNNDVHKLKGKSRLIGDETEVALYNFGKEFGFKKEDLQKKHTRIKEIPFSSERKMMSVAIKNNKKVKVYSKGAPEVLIEKCNKIFENGKTRKLTEKDKKRILNKNDEFSSRALRVLGTAYKEAKDSIKEENIEKDLVWIGLIGIRDPVRKGVKGALEECKTAGIRVLMLTGDNPKTAKAIASEIGLKTSESLTGKDLEKMDDDKLSKKISNNVNVFARINPEQKLRIMKILKSQGNVVSMTGDGVNDALALKIADVGVSMSKKGTDVAKQASDIVLLNDNFVNIVSGVKEGRRIFDNCKKFVNYLLTSNFAEVMLILIATLFLTLEYPILLPVQLLWINLLTDGFPALALGVDPPSKDIMKRKPRNKSEGIINKEIAYLTLIIGSIIVLTLLGIFFLTNNLFNEEIARTTIFTGLILFEFVRIGSIRYREKQGWFSNKLLLIALGVSLLLQIIIIYTPMNNLFELTPLGLFPWLILIGGTIITYIASIFATKGIVKFLYKKNR